MATISQALNTMFQPTKLVFILQVTGGDAYVGARTGAMEFWSGSIFLACAAPGVMPLADIRAIEQFAAFIGDAPYV